MRPILALILAGCAHFPLRAVPEGAGVRPDREVGPHDDAQTEWWHVHADLADTVNGEPLHVFAAFVVQRTDLDRAALVPVSAAVNPFHAAYLRLQSGERAWSDDRYNFPDLIAARFRAEERPGARRGESLDLRHGDWRVRWEEGALVLDVSTGGQALELKLLPTQPPTLPGAGGRVELAPGAGHLWVQDERMAAQGRWTDGRRTRWVEGTGFAKHQWGRLYSPEIDGFQWFSMDLPGGQSLSVGWLEDDGMHGVPGSLAWVSGGGTVVPIPASLLRVEETREWRSRRSGASWPVGFHLTGPGFDLALEALADDQEVWSFPAPLWGGPARATGTWFGEEVDLTAFVEQAGARVPRLRALLRSDSPR